MEEVMMSTLFRVGFLASLCLAFMAAITFPALAEQGKSPAEGYSIHVQAPHVMEDGTVGGPFHHYCKGISEKILQCLLFDSTDPNAKLVAVEYFVAKDLSRKEIPLIMWHRHYHDHKVEIDTGRVQVLEPADKAKEIAEAAAKTDGIIFHLWQKEDPIPTGRVTFPQSVGHEFPRRKD
jgi:hypothetical protein